MGQCPVSIPFTMSEQRLIIAIDGPAASGKSTLACLLSEELKIPAVNSGLFYRAFTWAVVRAGTDVAAAAEVHRVVSQTEVDAEFSDPPGEVVLPGEFPQEVLRSAAVNVCVAAVSAYPFVRERVNGELHRLASLSDCIVEGRDIGTFVFPRTPFKIYLEAPVDVRARRRNAQGEQDNLATRDAADRQRVAAPLRPADDAEVICVADKSPSEVLAAALECLAEKNLKRPFSSQYKIHRKVTAEI